MEPMAKFKHLTKEKFDNVCYRLFEIQNELNGLGALFEAHSTESCMSPDELFGVGRLIKHVGRELSIQEEILREGYDSQAVTKEPPSQYKNKERI